MIFQVQDNTITAYGTIWEGNGMEFVSIFTRVESQYEKIYIKLHTYGGSVFDGNLMFNALCNSKKSVVLQIVGIAASMGAVLALSLDEVYMVENGYLMIHTCSGQTYGSAKDHENNAKLLRSIENNFIKKLIKKTGKSESYVKKWLEGDNWFDAETAKKEGLIKDVIEPESETLTASLNPKELGAEGMYYQFSALLNTENPQINIESNMKKPIIEALGLQGVNEQSSDTAVIEAVKKHYEAKNTETQTKLDAEIAKRVAAEQKLADQGKAAITAELEAAKKAGKITAEQEATYQAIGTASGIEALKTVLAAIPARNPITAQINSADGKNNPSALGRENWDFDKWQKEDPKGFEALAKENPEAFQAILNAKYKK